MKTALVVALLGGVVLSGCVTKEECAAVDWYAFGIEDGRTGYLTYGDDVDRYVEACRGHGIAFDSDAYDDGFEEGYGQFCTSDWRRLGLTDGGDGVAARDMVQISGLCGDYGETVNADDYVAGFTEGANRYCEGIDWYEEGAARARDGATGVSRPVTPPACKSVSLYADEIAYRRGFEAEQLRICGDEAMFRAGKRGVYFNSACSGVSGAKRAFEDGERAGDLEDELAALNDKRRAIKDRGRNPALRAQAERDLAAIKADIGEVEAELYRLRP